MKKKKKDQKLHRTISKRTKSFRKRRQGLNVSKNNE
jgi:hypothetical protein